MRFGTTSCAVALGIAAAGLSFAAPATADTNLGTNGAYTYIRDAVTIGPNVSLSLRAECPPGTHLVSGGADDDRFDFLSNLQSSYPVDLGDGGKAPDDGWFMRSHNGLMSNASPEVFAVCQDAKPTYVKKQAEVKADSGRGIKVECPGSSYVMSGGLQARGPTPEVALTSLAPYDGSDKNSAPGDGWRAKVFNPDAKKHGMTVYAICQAGKPSYKFTDPPLASDPGTYSSTIPCLHPEDAVVGGGVWLGGPATAARLHQSTPADDADMDVTPDDWRLGYGIQEMTLNRTAYVICA